MASLEKLSKAYEKLKKKSKQDREAFQSIIAEMKQERLELKTAISDLHSELRNLARHVGSQEQDGTPPTLGGQLLQSSELPTFPQLERCVKIPTVKNKRGQTTDAQFSWGLYKDLMKQALGDDYQAKFFRTAKSNCRPIAKLAGARLRDECLEKMGEVPDLWREVPDELQLGAMADFEKATVRFLPLSMCNGSWGARLFLRKFWKPYKKSATGPAEVSLPPAVDPEVPAEEAAPRSPCAEGHPAAEGTREPAAAIAEGEREEGELSIQGANVSPVLSLPLPDVQQSDEEESLPPPKPSRKRSKHSGSRGEQGGNGEDNAEQPKKRQKTKKSNKRRK
ncbi:hypothetical protein BJV82DRAFT_612691 [Fennellomyces sp. T-0311]|nr:hypothetical protein BJV82DRAFT_612691 [Fennellomyces sp. T-0311]